MKKIDRRIIIVAAFIFIVGLSFGLMKYLISLKEEPPVRMQADIKRYVKTEKVKYGVITSPVEAAGRVNALSSIDIIAEATGKIIKGDVVLKKGEEFRKGDLLFTVYRDEALLDLQGRKSQFMNSIASMLPDINIDFPEHIAGFTEFFNSIDIKDELPEMPDVREEKLKVFLSSRGVLSEYYSILRDELKLERHNVYAPFNGTFSEVYLEAGAYTNAGGRVAHAIQTDLLEQEVPVKKDDALWIKVGDRVKVFRKGQEAEWTGTVVRKGMFVDEETQSQAVFISLRSLPGQELMNGEWLTARFPGHPEEGVMEIPRNSVFNNDEVFVVVDGRLEKRVIEVVKTNEKTLIFRGLNEGDIVVTQALINVQEGIQVTTDLSEDINGRQQGDRSKQGAAKATPGN